MNDAAPQQTTPDRRGLGQRRDRRSPARARVPYIALTPGASFRGAARQPRQLSRQHAARASAVRARRERGRARPWLCARDRAAACRRAACERRADACDDGDLQRVVRSDPDAAPGRRGPDRCRQAPAVGRLDPHDARSGRARARLYEVGRPAGIGGGGAQKRSCAPIGSRRRCRRDPSTLSLDAALQEEALDGSGAAACARPLPGGGASRLRRRTRWHEVAGLLKRGAQSRCCMIGRVSSDPADFARRVALAERLGAVVLTDIKTGASFPTQHRLQPFPPSLYVTGDASRLIRDADVIVSLDWIDLGGTLAQACGGELPRAQGRPMLARSVRPQRLEHGLSGAAADRHRRSSRRRTRWSRRCSRVLGARFGATRDPVVHARPAEDSRSARPRARARAHVGAKRRRHACRSRISRASRRRRSRRIDRRTCACRSAGRESTAGSSIRRTTSASTAAAASARVRAWRSAPRSRCATWAPIGFRSRCSATATT